ncbi:PA0069 family radical SAM protein [Dongia deserti]|uniref:PA0069 family radical SAM protein n=1 Tax=Dongia deserti TaxID=2268030 RepID=UPI000E65497C|nr:PA0069 family radical SAM protein [Dongia deserti]
MAKYEPEPDLTLVPDPTLPNQPVKGRGAVSNRPGRYELGERPLEDDGWSLPAARVGGDPDGEPPPLATKVAFDSSRTIMAHNQSPDVPFDRSVNTYRGCEHGCVYCYARPTHAYLGLSPGLDFESRLFAKADAAKLLIKELKKPGYKPDVLALGAVTDVYQPIERQYRITRGVLKVLSDFNHPVGITTKSARVLDDLDIIADMAKRQLIMVSISVTTLDRALARKLEPRASTPPRRLGAIRQLSAAGVPVAISVAPIIPAITDHEIESIIAAGAEAGAQWINWTLLRLPLEIKDLFAEWLVAHAPGKAKHAMSLISQCHGGIAYRSEWGKRMKGEGSYADMIRLRVEAAAKRHGLDKREYDLDCSRFAVPKEPDRQFDLFC